MSTNILILVLCLGKFAISNAVKGVIGEGMRNKHLIIEGEYWSPFLTYDYDEHDTAIEGTYKGILYDLLVFMQKARNFTFTMVHEADYVWGRCYATNNCTGMIGMVNRREVDFAIGNFHFQSTSTAVLKKLLFRTI